MLNFFFFFTTISIGSNFRAFLLRHKNCIHMKSENIEHEIPTLRFPSKSERLTLMKKKNRNGFSIYFYGDKNDTIIIKKHTP